MPGRIDEAAALPPRDLWPVRKCNLPELRYAAEMNLSVELLDRHLPTRACQPAVVSLDGRLTYADLADRVSRVGHALRQVGVGTGDRVLIRLPIGARLATAWLAVQRLGGIAVMTVSSLRTRELAAIIADAEPAACIVAADLTAHLLDACPTKDPPRVLVAGVTTAAAPLVSLDRMLVDAPAHLEPVGRPADAVAVIAYTADAEAVAPKGACHSIADLLATADTYAHRVLKIGPEDVIGGPTSPAFAFGLGAKLVFPLHAGAATVLVENFDAEALSASIGRERITLLFGTATTYRLLLRAPDFDRHTDFRSLRLAISSAERLDADLAVDWKRRTGVELLDGFGTTEMAHMFLSQRAGEGGSGHLGTAVPGYDVRVVDDGFVDAAAGVAGRLIVRGPTGCRYWRRPEAQRRYVQRGWNVTGDVCVRGDGLRFVARYDDLIISAGYNISAAEVEAVLREHPAVADAAVVSAPDSTRGAVPRAIVVLRANVARDGLELAILQHVRDSLAGYKCPRRLDIVGALPRDSTGAIDRAALRGDGT